MKVGLSYGYTLILCMSLGACSDALDLVEIATDGVGRLISSEAVVVDGTEFVNCRYRREDGQEWVRRQSGECDPTDSNYRINP